MTTTIRLATVADLPWLRALYAGLVREQQARHGGTYPTVDDDELDAFTRIVYRHFTLNPDGFRAWLAEDAAHRPVGMLAGEVSERAVGKPHHFAAPHWLYVTPDARDGVAARALIAAGLAFCAERGLDAIEVTALAGDAQWARRGFAPYCTKYHVPLAAAVQHFDASRAPRRAAPPSPAKPPRRPRPTRKRPRTRGPVNGHDREAEV